MSKPTHTPGPWKQQNLSVLQEHSEGIGLIAHCYANEGHDFDDAEAIANARLIAAAPELIEALRAFVEASTENAPTALAMCVDRAASDARTLLARIDGDAVAKAEKETERQLRAIQRYEEGE